MENKKDDEKSSKSDDLKIFELQYQHAWNYFQLHAQQRLTLFKYYITLLTFLTAAAGFLYVKFPFRETTSEHAGIFIMILFILVTFIFWRLDWRNEKSLQKSRNAIFKLEEKELVFKKEDPQLKIFIADEDCCNCNRYTVCFYAIFVTGLLAAVFYIIFAMQSCDNSSCPKSNSCQLTNEAKHSYALNTSSLSITN